MRRRPLLIGATAAIALSATRCGAPSAITEPEKVRTIGYLSVNTTSTALKYGDIIRDVLRSGGYRDARDFTIVFRLAENEPERLPAMAAELVALQPSVIVSEAAAAALAAKKATTTIPIVFWANDPVGQGIVTSLARPGGNITGMATLSSALSAKRVEVLKQTVPLAVRLAVIWSTNQPGNVALLRETEDAAWALGMSVEAYPVHNTVELDAALEEIARTHPDALLSLQGLSSISRDYNQVPDFAAKIRLPQTYSDGEFVRRGGLMAVGSNTPALVRQAAGLVLKIMKGARPGDLPVEQATQLDFVINLTTAQRLGLSFPESVARQATEVVR